MKINMPDDAKLILNVLQKNGYEAYIVGGCVRDAILGREAQDWDITTNAKPEQVKNLFNRTIDTGIQHGTVTVMIHGVGYEVTTYRVDGEYEDGRHPKEVIFVPDLKEDLRRRDFTINAMAYNDVDGLVDIFGGLDDIEKKTIRCVGVAEERFSEDALRIMRAVRFSAQLGYEIEENTVEAIIKKANTLEKISAERIQTELTKLCLSIHPDYVEKLQDTGIMKVILPTVCDSYTNNKALKEKTLNTIKNIAAVKHLRLAAFLRVISHDEAADVFKNLKFDNDTKTKVCKILKFENELEAKPNSDAEARSLISVIGKEMFGDILEYKIAEVGSNETEYAENIQIWKSIYNETIDKNYCVDLKNLAVTGKDLMEAGVEKGPGLGEKLAELLDVVLKNPEKNEREYLLSLVK